MDQEASADSVNVVEPIIKGTVLVQNRVQFVPLISIFSGLNDSLVPNMIGFIHSHDLVLV